jgi:hypothetical protein
VTRLSVNISESTEDAIRHYTEVTGVNATEAVRRLIAYGTAVFQADQDGKKVLLKDAGRLTQLVLLDQRGH